MNLGDLFDMFNNDCEENSGCNQMLIVILIILALMCSCGCGGCNCGSSKHDRQYCSGGCNGSSLGLLILIIFMIFSPNFNDCEGEVTNVDDC